MVNNVNFSLARKNLIVQKGLEGARRMALGHWGDKK
jgi:hypothetical protein